MAIVRGLMTFFSKRTKIVERNMKNIPPFSMMAKAHMKLAMTMQRSFHSGIFGNFHTATINSDWLMMLA